MSLALDRVRRVLSPLILRRSKDTLNKHGEPILTLPPMEVKTVEVHLSTPEREFYNALKSKSQSIFEGIVEKGSFSKSYFQIFALLNRLRQTCNHVALTVKSHLDDWSPTEILDSTVAKSPKKKTAAEIRDGLNEQFLQSLLEKFRTKQPDKENHLENHQSAPSKNSNNEFCMQVAKKLSQAVSSSHDEVDDECAICLENPKINDVVVTPCAHVFCRDCLVKILQGSAPGNPTVPDGECPCCKAKIDAKRIIALHRGQDGTTETKYLLDTKFQPKAELLMYGAARQTLENALSGAGSSKLTAILHELDEIWKVDPGSKVLIFSQFLGFLDLMQLSLRKKQIPHWRLDGSLSLAQRKDVVEKFKKELSSPTPASNKGSVLLMSMKAGGVGLNLVQASSVFIVDPWWNAAIEDQCIMRCHRIGQVAPVVRVRKFVVKHSVEERIVSLQERKKSMAGQILEGTQMESANKATLDDFRLLFAGI
jgi:DNA repair protein RAD5